MSIKSTLDKEGIEVINKINTLKVNAIATNISKKLVNSFPEQNFNYHELFSKFSRLNMYIAKLPNGVAAKYFYKNSSIYFNEDCDLNNLNNIAIHECIHFLQSKINSKGKLIKLGLCDFKDMKLSGMALNEAAVQLMTMKCSKSKFDTVKYFDITLPSNSPDYYTLECNLVRQLAYVTGEYILYNSTLYGNDNFKNKFITLTSKEDYEYIKNNINTIMYLEDQLHEILNIVQNSEKITPRIASLMRKSAKIKEYIRNKFITTQNRIITSFFDNLFNSLYTEKSMENYRKSLYNFKNFIGTTDNYTFFNDYYISKMSELEEKYQILPNKQLALVKYSNNIIYKIFRKIKKLFGLNSEYELKYVEK